MKKPDGNYAKILFCFHSDSCNEAFSETMWAIIVDEEKGLYKLDSIPFYAPDIASNDIIFAAFDNDEKMLIYRETVEYCCPFTIVKLDAVPGVTALNIEHCPISILLLKKMRLCYRFLEE